MPMRRCSLVLLLLYITQGCSNILVNQSTFFPSTNNAFNPKHFNAPITHTFLTTEDGVNISSYFLPRAKSPHAIIFFHGNAGNASHRLKNAVRLWSLDMNVLLVDYRGYGRSDGSPSEPGIYQDGAAALTFLTQQQGFPLENIALYGRSLGSAVAVDLAQHQPLAGVILLSPLSSGLDVADHLGLWWLKFLLGDPFNSFEKLENLRAPLLILHGDQDQVLPIEMGRKLTAQAKVDSQFIRIPGAGHNDLIGQDPDYFYACIAEFLHRIFHRS